MNSHGCTSPGSFGKSKWSGWRLIISPMIIGPLQGLFDDGTGESFGWVDADEQGWCAASGGPRVCLGRERVVNPGQRAAPGEPGHCGELVAGVGRDRREVDNGEVGELEQRGEEPVGVGAPRGGPHDLEPGGEFAQPWPVRRAQPYRSSPGKNSCSV
jgi:hypothetical protein